MAVTIAQILIRLCFDFMLQSPFIGWLSKKEHREVSQTLFCPTVPTVDYSMFSGYSSMVSVAEVMSLMQSMDGAEGRLLR